VNVLVDTSVWSLALRRAKRVDDAVRCELAELISEGRVVLLGPVRQELLSGIKVKSQFDLLRDHLRSFPDLELETADYEEASAAFNPMSRAWHPRIQYGLLDLRDSNTTQIDDLHDGRGFSSFREGSQTRIAQAASLTVLA
jgi:predicted nucleic acid-binding protein